jgi:hypothetical protein
MTGRTALAALGLLLAVAGPAAANDHYDVGQVVLTRVTTPGVPVTGCGWNSSVFFGTLVLAGPHAGTYEFRAHTSSDGCVSLASETGRGTVSGAFAGTFLYVRTLTSVTISGTWSIGGHPHRIMASYVAAVPTALDPVTSEAWTGTLAFR